MLKIFLTGGTGFIGRRLTKSLLNRGWEVTVLVRNPDSAGAKAIQEQGARLVKGDITEPGNIRDAMQGFDVVIHGAAWYEFGIPKKAWHTMEKINVQGTKHILGQAVELGIPKIIYISSIVAFGATGDVIADETFKRSAPYHTYYEETKTIAHEIAVEHQRKGAPIVIVCPAIVIGPGDHSNLGYLSRMYIRGMLPPVLYGEKGTISFVYVDDAVESITLTVEKGKEGGCYILTSGNMKCDKMIDLWKQTPGGIKRTLLWMPKSMALLFCSAAEPFQRLLGLPVVFSREYVLLGYTSWQYTAAKAEAELGMRFRSLEKAWIDTLEGERNILKTQNRAGG